MSSTPLDQFRAATWAGRYRMLLTGEVTPEEVSAAPDTPEPLRELCLDPDRTSVAASFERHGLLEQVRRALPHDETSRDLVSCDLALAYRRGKLAATGEVLRIAGLGTLVGAARVCGEGGFRAELYRAAADALIRYAAEAGGRARDGGRTAAECENQASRALIAAWRVSRQTTDSRAALELMDNLDADGLLNPALLAEYGELLGYRFLEDNGAEVLDRTINVLTRAVASSETPRADLPEAHRRLGIALAQRAIEWDDPGDRERAEAHLAQASRADPNLGDHCTRIRDQLTRHFG